MSVTLTQQEVEEQVRGIAYNSRLGIVNRVSDTTIEVGGDRYNLSDDAFQDLMKMSGHRSLRKIPRSLSAPVINHAISGRELRVAVNTSDTAVRCFNRDVKMLEHERLIEALHTGVGRKFNSYRNLNVSPVGLSVCGVLPVEEEVVPGDNVYLGVGLEWSTNGHTKISVAPFIERQICTNGATATNWLKLKRGREELDPYTTVAQAATEATSNFDTVVGFLRESARTVVDYDKQEDAIRRLMGGCGIPGKWHKLVLDHWKTQPQGDRSLWDLLNLITYVGEHDVFDPQIAWRIMGVGRHALHSRSVCTECRRLTS